MTIRDPDTAAVDSISRASADDLMSLATQGGRSPMQVGAVLTLEGVTDPGHVVDAVEGRLPAVPRLRQKLVHLPAVLGRPVWVDDEDFALEDHLCVHPPVRDMTAVLGLSADLLLTPLPTHRPLWSARIVPITDDGATAVIFVLHHALADGVGALEILELLAGHGAIGGRGFPARAPTTAELAGDAWRARGRELRRLPASLRRLVQAIRLLGPSLQRIPPSSLNRPVGTRRRFLPLHGELAPLKHCAHATDATVNDVLLVAVSGALRELARHRGEILDLTVLSVPFSERRDDPAASLGNRSGAVPVRVPARGDAIARLHSTAAVTRAIKRGQRGASTAVLGPLFRVVSRLGYFQRFIDHQHLVHSFVTNVAGPSQSLAIGSYRVAEIIPLTVAVGNVTVSFAALSYAGRVTVTIAVDPDACPDADLLRTALKHQLVALTGDQWSS